MSTSIYKINKGINQPLVFKGLKAQYIWWLGGGIMVLMFVFSILYIVGINVFICVALNLIAGLGIPYLYNRGNGENEGADVCKKVWGRY